jgi:hypothetical protein
VRRIGAFALYARLAVALTWPLATHRDTFVAGRGDRPSSALPRTSAHS